MTVPRSVTLLTNMGIDALRPKMHKGRYIGPMVSRRQSANIQKKALAEGTYGTWVPNKGGWNPKWDKQRKIVIPKPFKGHLNERTRAARAKKIDDALKTTDEKMRKYEQEVEARKPKKDLQYVFDRVTKLVRGF